MTSPAYALLDLVIDGRHQLNAIDADGNKQVFDVTNSGSYLSANDSRVLVGLGEDTSVKAVEIRWPSGKVQKLENLAIDCYHQVSEK